MQHCDTRQKVFGVAVLSCHIDSRLVEKIVDPGSASTPLYLLLAGASLPGMQVEFPCRYNADFYHKALEAAV